MKVLVLNDSGACELQKIIKYPSLASSDGTVSLTPSTDATTGQITWDVKVSQVVDVNVENVTIDAASKELVVTETDGTENRVDISDLLKTYTITNTSAVGNKIGTFTDTNTGAEIDINETITALALEGAGVKHTSEDGTVSVVTLCSMLSAVPDNGNSFGV